MGEVRNIPHPHTLLANRHKNVNLFFRRFGPAKKCRIVRARGGGSFGLKISDIN